MGNYAQLISVPNTELASTGENERVVLRYAKNIIPLFWWGLFDDGDLIRYDVDCIHVSGAPIKTPMWTLLKEKNSAIDSINKFGAGLSSVIGIPQPSADCLRRLTDEISVANGRALQLDCSELQMLMESEDFRRWIGDGFRFGDTVRARRLKNFLTVSEELLDLSGIYAESQNKTTERERFDKIDFSEKAAEVAATPPTKSKEAEVQLESADWEHSLVGMPASPTLDEPAKSSPPMSPKPWWHFWK